MMLTLTLAAPLLLSSLVQTPQPPDVPVRPVDPVKVDQESADRERAKQLLNQLEDALAKTASAHERVARVTEVLRQIEEIGKADGQGTSDEAIINATAELTATLKSHISKLYTDSSAIRDAIKRDVIPERAVNTTRVRSRLELMKREDPDFAEVEQIYEHARVQETRLNEQVTRLDSNLTLLRAVRDRLTDRERVINLWREVNIKGDELIKQLTEFNRKVEDIAKQLNPVEG